MNNSTTKIPFLSRTADWLARNKIRTTRTTALFVALLALEACPAARALPTGILDLTPVDIGNPVDVGRTTPIAGVADAYSIDAGGADIWGASDQMHYAYATVSGDFDVRVRVDSIYGINQWSKAGIMVRESTAPNSRNVFVVTTPTGPLLPPATSGTGQNEFRFAWRGSNANGNSFDTGGGKGNPQYPNAWLRLRRVGNVIIGYRGSDGEGWVEIGRQDTSNWPTSPSGAGPLANQLLLGLAATSHNNTAGFYTTADFYSFSDTPQLPIQITAQPAPINAVENSAATFSLGLSGYDPYEYQWLKDGQLIAGATNATYTISPVTLAMSGTSYSVIVKNTANGQPYTVTSDAAALSVSADPTPPTLATVGSYGHPARITVAFSEGVAAAEATNPAKYSVNGGSVAISSVTLLPDQKTVQLDLAAPLVELQTYTVSVRDIKDLAVTSNTIDPNPSETNFIHAIEYYARITNKRYDSITGNAVSNLRGSTRFPNSPNAVSYPATFADPAPNADNYGGWTYGLLVPPVTGSYHFAISSDNNSELRLGTNDTPASARVIATNPDYNDQYDYTSTTRRNATAPQNVSWTLFPDGIYLEAGKRYYMEGLFKEGSGGQHFSATWEIPGDPQISNSSRPIPNTYFAVSQRVFSGTLGPLAITRQPANASIRETETATFTVAVDGTPATFANGVAGYTAQWFVNGQPIAGATSLSYTTARAIYEQLNGAVFKVAVSNAFSSVLSTEVSLTVTQDLIPPTVVSAGTIDGSTIGIRFSELLDRASAQTVANYTVPGVTITGASLRPDGLTVLLTLTGTLPSPFTVTVNSVADMGGNSVAPNTSTQAALPGLTATTLIRTPTDPATPGSAFSYAAGAFTMTADGSDIWNEADAGLLVHRETTGDFDLKVQALTLTRPDNWTKAGIMAREDLTGGSRQVMNIVTPSTGQNDWVAQMRRFAGGASERWRANNQAGDPVYPNVWVRLRRIGDDFWAYWGTDGLSWSESDHVVLDLPDMVYAGLVLTSHSIGNVATVEFEQFGAFTYPGAAVEITQNLTNQTVVEGRALTLALSANFTGAPASEAVYRWQQSTDNGTTWTDTAIVRAPTWTSPGLTLTDSGVQYRVKVLIPGVEVTSAVAKITVVRDTEPPQIASATRSCGIHTEVTVLFSEDIDPASLATATFAVNNAVTVSSAAAGTSPNTVYVATSEIADGQRYTLTVSGVKDTKGNIIAANSQALIGLSTAPSTSGAQNIVVVEAEDFSNSHSPTSGNMAGVWWKFVTVPAGFGGTGAMGTDTVAAGGQSQNTGYDNPTSGTPRLDYCINFPVPGIYYVWVRVSALDGNADSMHAGVDMYADPYADRIQGGGSGYSSWTWTRSTMDPEPASIEIVDAGRHILNLWVREDGMRVDRILLTTDNAYTPSGTGPAQSPRAGDPTITLSAPAANTVYSVGNTVTLSATADDADGAVALVEYYINGIKVGESSSSPFTATWLASTEGSFTILARALDNVGGGAYSAPVRIAVDSTPPSVLSVGSYDGSNVGVRFNEAVNAASATDKSKYSVNNGTVAVTSASLRPDGQTVALQLGQTLTAPYSVTVKPVSDANGNVMAADATLSGTIISIFDAADVGLFPNPVTSINDPLEAGSSFSWADNLVEIRAGGSDIYNDADGLHFSYLQAAGDFDYKARVRSLDPVNRWSKAGLMARETLQGPSRTIQVVVDPEGITRDGQSGGTGADTYEVQFRPFVNGLTADGSHISGNAVRTWIGGATDTGNAQFPDAWLRLQRVGSTFSAYRGITGSDWTRMAQMNWDATTLVATNANGIDAFLTAFPQSVYLGLAASAHNNAAAMLTTAIFQEFQPETGPANRPIALFLTGNVGFNSGDAAVVRRLVGLGFYVEVRHPLRSATADADGKALIVNSSTISSGDVGTKFQLVAVPVVNWEQANQDEFLLTVDDATHHGETGGQNSLQIINANHPLAAGLSAGPLLATTVNETFTWGVPPSNAQIVATLATDASRAAIYAFETGDLLVDGTTPAPARRVHLFLQNTVPASLTPEGWALFDAAVNWAAGRTAIESPTIEYSVTTTDLTITWSGSGFRLQEAATLTNPQWEDVSGGASAPVKVSITTGTKFYRLIYD